MPKRIVRAPVLVNRDGKSFTPRIGEVFDFTDKELKEINALKPDAIEHILVPDAPVQASAVKAG